MFWTNSRNSLETIYNRIDQNRPKASGLNNKYAVGAILNAVSGYRPHKTEELL